MHLNGKTTSPVVSHCSWQLTQVLDYREWNVGHVHGWIEVGCFCFFSHVFKAGDYQTVRNLYGSLITLEFVEGDFFRG